MRTRILTGFVLAAALVAPAFAESPFVGKWIATAEAPTGPVSEVVVVAKSSDSYVITVEPVTPAPAGQPQAGPAKEIVLDGDRFSFKRVVEIPGNEIVIIYTGVVSADKFTGEVELVGIGKVPYNGVRNTEAK